MGYDANILRRATKELEEQAHQRQRALEGRRVKLYGQIPRLATIDRQLRQTVSQVIAASLQGGNDPMPAIQSIKAQNLALQGEREDLLVAHGYPFDALDETPACTLCGDRGWQGTQMCRCLKELCTKEQLAELSKLLNLGSQSFDTFSFDWYSTMASQDGGLSPRENMEFIHEVCLSYALKFPHFYFKNLFLTGTTGLGKTFLSACIARAVSEGGYAVVYDTAINILAQFEEEKFSRDNQEAKGETRRYLQCDLLILDDLGSEMTTPFVQSALYTLLNGRLLAGKSTVISSNLSMDEVRRRYAPQIASRLEGEYRVLPFFGQDIRLLKKEQL